MPVAPEMLDFIENHERVYVIEMNRDGQLHQILSIEISETRAKLISLTHNDGLQITANWVMEAILTEESK